MIAAHRPIQRPWDARLLVVDRRGRMTHAPRSRFVDFLRPGDLVIANDAATLPASLRGMHLATAAEIEVRLAARASLEPADIHAFTAVVFGAGDFHTRTEDRPLPPALAPGDRLVFGSDTNVRSLTFVAQDSSPALQELDSLTFVAQDLSPARQELDSPALQELDSLTFVAQDLSPARQDVDGISAAGHGQGSLGATIESLLDHPRLVRLRFGGSARAVWAGLARHGRPIQYAHVTTPLAMWDVWTPIAGLPAAFEPPSASFALDWRSIRLMRERGIRFATITLAAGISSTGDPELDRRLPFDEPYRIPEPTSAEISSARAEGRRIIAVGTTVVRGLEHAAALDGVVHPGAGIADQRVGPGSRLRIVDALLSGTHEPGGSHYQILRAFLDDLTLAAADAALDTQGYRTHEFGDSVLIERAACAMTTAAGPRQDHRIAPAA